MSKTLRSLPVERYGGTVRVPGDKSISHRALMIGSLADGDVEISGLALGRDVLSTLEAMRSLGVEIEREGDSAVVHGLGLEGLSSPDSPIDCGNSGTTIRLLSGLAAGAKLHATLTGDESLMQRPMGRISQPLRRIGALVQGREDARFAPLVIKSRGVRARSHRLEVASAQVKSCILLAGLFARGTTEIESPAPNRDHTERMLEHLGAEIKYDALKVALKGPARLHGGSINVPGDFSSAAFPVAAAPLIKRSKVIVQNVGLNPTRTGFLEVLGNMGARFETKNVRVVDNEMVGDLIVRYGQLKGCVILGRLIPRTIDELVVLAAMAASAKGRTVIKDAAELRHKESDRIASTVEMVKALGGEASSTDDGMVVQGLGGPLKGGTVHAGGDHRIALAALALGPGTQEGVSVEGAEAMDVSYPEFVEHISSLGGDIR